MGSENQKEGDPTYLTNSEQYCRADLTSPARPSRGAYLLWADEKALRARRK